MPDTTAEHADQALKFVLPQGSYQDALGWLGYHREIQFAEVEVNWAMIKVYAAMVEDPNPSYWDDEVARRIWGRVPAPPGMLHVWLMALQWRPDGTDLPFPLCGMVPLPGDTLINTKTETTFHRPMRVGDHLNMVERVESISPEKQTRLGTGHFVTTLSEYRTAEGHLVAEHVNTLLRFQAGGEPSATGGNGKAPAAPPPVPPGRPVMDDDGWWDAVSEGDRLPDVVLPISYARVVAIPATTWDYFPGHHDPFYAREQGQESIYLSTMFYSGFLDRIATDWTGPHGFVRGRELRMTGSVYPGDTLTGRGRVVGKRVDADGRRLVDIEVSATNDAGSGAGGRVTVTRSTEWGATIGEVR